MKANIEELEKISKEIRKDIIEEVYSAKSGHPGATFLSIPQDVTDAEVSIKAIQPLSDPKMGNASIDDINYLAQAIKNAVLPRDVINCLKEK